MNSRKNVTLLFCLTLIFILLLGISCSILVSKLEQAKAKLGSTELLEKLLSNKDIESWEVSYFRTGVYSISVAFENGTTIYSFDKHSIKEIVNEYEYLIENLDK